MTKQEGTDPCLSQVLSQHFLVETDWGGRTLIPTTEELTYAVSHMIFEPSTPYSITCPTHLVKRINGFTELSEDSTLLEHRVWETLAYSVQTVQWRHNASGHIKKRGEPKKNSAYMSCIKISSISNFIYFESNFQWVQEWVDPRRISSGVIFEPPYNKNIYIQYSWHTGVFPHTCCLLL
jgi:hypothetical protein